MKFSFVIPAYNNYALLHQLLFDIYKNCSPAHEIIVTDDGDDQATLDGLAWWKSTGLLPIIHDRHENMGFLRNSNYGLQKATGDIVCLVSTDVRIHKDLVSIKYHSDTLWGGRLLDWDTGWNKFDGKIYKYLEGWILTTSKSNWERLKYFDERYSPNDMEDIDFSTKALNAGLSLVPYLDGVVSHLGAQTIGYSSEREKITLENKKKFKKKWIK